MLSDYGLPFSQGLVFLRACGFESEVRGLRAELNRVDGVTAAVRAMSDALPTAPELLQRLACAAPLRMALGRFVADAATASVRALLGNDVLFENPKFRRQFPVAAAIGAPNRDKRMRAAEVADRLAGLCALSALHGLEPRLERQISSIALHVKDWEQVGRDLVPILKPSLEAWPDGHATRAQWMAGDDAYAALPAAIQAALDALRAAIMQLRCTDPHRKRPLLHGTAAQPSSSTGAEARELAALDEPAADGRADPARTAPATQDEPPRAVPEGLPPTSAANSLALA